MDVDGADNSFVRVEMACQDTAPGESPRRSYLKATRHVASTENDAKIRMKLYEPAEFHVINPTKKTRVGNPVGYKVVPAGTVASLLDPEDPPQKRVHSQTIRFGSRPTTKAKNGLVGCSCTRAKGRTHWIPGRRGTIRSRTRTSLCGTRWGSTTSPARRTSPSCPPSRPASTSSRSTSSRATLSSGSGLPK
ncbi:hypothetical protein ACQ4PT_044034 [Festuca glaucescens]